MVERHEGVFRAGHCTHRFFWTILLANHQNKRGLGNGGNYTCSFVHGKLFSTRNGLFIIRTGTWRMRFLFINVEIKRN